MTEIPSYTWWRYEWWPRAITLFVDTSVW